MRIDSHVCFSPRHPPEHLQAILARNRFNGAMLLLDGTELPVTPPHILGLIVRGSAPPDSRTNPKFRAMSCPLECITPRFAEDLAGRGIPLDVEMHPADFPQLLRLAGRTPGLRLAIDHLARPAFRQGITDEWMRGMESAASFPQVFCKISGLLTEVEQLPWSATPFRPFVQHALAVFGPNRLMFGSEWPLRLPDITWKETLAAFTQSIGAHSIEAREQLLGESARAFYGIESSAADASAR